MKSMHSIDTKFVHEIFVMATAEMMRCDTDFDEEKISDLKGEITFSPEFLLSEEKSHI